MSPEDMLNRLRDETLWNDVRIPRLPERPRARGSLVWRVLVPVVGGLAVAALVISGVNLIRASGQTPAVVAPEPTRTASAHPTPIAPTSTPTSPAPHTFTPSSTTTYGPRNFPGGKVTASNPWGIPAIADVADPQFLGPWDNDGLMFGSDTGPRKGAMGRVFSDRDGHPIRYVAVSGDVFASIADRLGGLYLSKLNCVRRGAENTVYVGDTINLSPYTVTTVGTQNGSSTSDDPLVAKSCLTQTALPPQH